MHFQGQKIERKHTTKNFVEFHSHSPLLTTFLSNQWTVQLSRTGTFHLHHLLVVKLRTAGYYPNGSASKVDKPK